MRGVKQKILAGESLKDESRPCKMAKIERSLGHVTTISHPYDFDLTVLTGNREVSHSLVTHRPTSALAMRLLNTHSAPYSILTGSKSKRVETHLRLPTCQERAGGQGARERGAPLPASDASASREMQ